MKKTPNSKFIFRFFKYNFSLKERITELEQELEVSKAQNAALQQRLLMAEDRPLVSSTSARSFKILAPTPTHPKPMEKISRQMMHKRAQTAADEILNKYKGFIFEYT